MPGAAVDRRAREADLVAATRALFDERGVQEAPVAAVARAAGIDKALVYRHFGSKDELFVLTVTSYLDELRNRGEDLDDSAPPAARLRAQLEIFTAFCLEFPAFLDCAMSLMQRPSEELQRTLSDGVWLRIARAMALALGPMEQTLRDGGVADPALLANVLYTQVLGTMHLARLGIGVTELHPGVPGGFPLEPEQVRAACIDAALRSAGL